MRPQRVSALEGAAGLPSATRPPPLSRETPALVVQLERQNERGAAGRASSTPRLTPDPPAPLSGPR